MSSTATRPRPTRPPARAAKGGTRSRLPLTAALVVLGLLAIAVIVSMLGGSGEEAGGERLQTSPVEISGATLPPYAAGAADAAVGSAAPRVTGLTMDGLTADLTPDGKPLVVLFATHWCSYCQAEVAELSPWLADGAADELGVDVVAVSTSVDERQGNYPPSEWLDREGWPMPVLRDDAESSAANAYGLTSFPYFVILDAEGTVLARHGGGLGAQALTDLVTSVTR